MEFLKEMINFQQDFDTLQLLEDLGNLKEIDPKFIKALKNSYSTGKYDDKGQWRTFERSLLSTRAGRGSKVEEKALSTAKAIATEFETDPSVIALVIFDKKTGVQYGIIAEQKPKAYKQERTLKVMINVKAISGKGATPDMMKSVREYFADKVKVHSFDIDQIGQVTTDFTSGKVYNALNHLNKFLKSPERELAVKVIHSDEERPTIRKERSSARSGMIPIKLDGKAKEDFINQAKRSLSVRLDKYKSEKIRNSNSNVDMADFMEVVKEKGYLDKFMVDGYIYEYYRDSFNFNNMRSGKHKDARWESDTSYVTYKIDDDAPEYSEVRRQYWEKTSELRDLGTDEEAYQKERDKLKKRLKLPPNYIKVFFDFEGGRIVPYKIELESNN